LGRGGWGKATEHHRNDDESQKARELHLPHGHTW
jgi:hypothetical protein